MKQDKTRILSGQIGFTLLELLITLLIAGLVLTAMYVTFISQFRAYQVQEQVNEMVQTSRVVVDMMSREIRMAGYNPTGAVFTGVDADTSQLRFRADFDGSGTLDDEETIAYSYDNSAKQLVRTTSSGAALMADNIQGFTFDLLNKAGSVTATAADIREVRIVVTSRTARADPGFPANSGYRTYVLTSRITPKNLGYQ